MLLILKELTWGHLFSYGDNNRFVFNEQPLIQLIGKNGHGKTSIALILEEVLFNTNSKKTKRAKVLNRYSKSKSYWIRLTFDKDGNQYEIYTTRSSTQTVKLTENGIDISEHTATATYKLIESIVGIDHKAFTQIVNQSNANSLEFLKATDSNRKKFLIDFFDLSIYTKGSELFKQLVKDKTNEVDVAKSKISSLNSWLDKIKNTDLTIKDLLEVPQEPREEINKLAELKFELANIEQSNKAIIQMNTYISIFDGLTLLTEIGEPDQNQLLEYKTELKLVEAAIKTNESAGNVRLLDKCLSCGQIIDVSHKQHIKDEALKALPELKTKKQSLENSIKSIQKTIDQYNVIKENNANWEKYFQLVGNSKKKEPLNKEAIQLQIRELESKINSINKLISTNKTENIRITQENTKVSVIEAEIGTIKEDLIDHNTKLNLLEKELNNLQVLAKVFGTSGLVTYKIEGLVKELESTTNSYLAEMSDGRFQLSFRINSSDKLNVIITDNGIEVDIDDLSNGELARVNTSTLLGLRKLLQAKSKSKINVLILDETIDCLDDDGKERLIEVLLSEKHINTILISHGFSHPLLSKIHVIKTNNISRIENG